jgi:hypothetical protein
LLREEREIGIRLRALLSAVIGSGQALCPRHQTGALPLQPADFIKGIVAVATGSFGHPLHGASSTMYGMGAPRVTRCSRGLVVSVA